MIVAAVDPVLLGPPELDSHVHAADWVAQISAWTDLVADGVISTSCPRSLYEPRLAQWWDERAHLVALLNAEGSPLTHHDLLLVLEQLRGRLRESPLADGIEIVFSNLNVTPEYLPANLTADEGDDFEQHLGVLAQRQSETQGTALVLTNGRSWSGDPEIITVRAEVDTIFTSNTFLEFQEEDLLILERLTGCCTISAVYKALLREPGCLMVVPGLGVKAFAATALGISSDELSFTIADSFKATAERMNYNHEHSRARTCLRAMALIAAGRGKEITGLNAHAVRIDEGGAADVLKDSRGRILMRGYLSQNSPDAHRLHWWNGEPPEFVAVSRHDDPIPDFPMT